MAFVKPTYTRGQVNRAGDVLSRQAVEPLHYVDVFQATEVLNNWRASHLYPINTFQATLRNRLKRVDKTALVGQRLKRTPSILAKLRAQEGMQLARMQDIGGLRAVVGSVARVRQLETMYRSGGLQHELLTSKDYILEPKADGYRSVHLVFKYQNAIEPAYDGLRLELQIRTKSQHGWATAVETASTFLGQALKAGQGDDEWKEFFVACSAAISNLEETPPVPGFEGSAQRDVLALVSAAEVRLNALARLRGYSIAAEGIHRVKGSGRYHLVELNTETRTVHITPYPTARLYEAEAAYATAEKRAKEGEPIDVVLVAAGSIEKMKRAYPNYFLDTQSFIGLIGKLITWKPRTESWTEHVR